MHRQREGLELSQATRAGHRACACCPVSCRRSHEQAQCQPVTERCRQIQVHQGGQREPIFRAIMVRPGLRLSSGLPQMLWSCLDLRMTARKDKVVAFSSRKETIKKRKAAMLHSGGKGSLPEACPRKGVGYLLKGAIPEGENIKSRSGERGHCHGGPPPPQALEKPKSFLQSVLSFPD